MTDPAAKFDAARASDYAVQSRIALAGYEACHELGAALLSASLQRRHEADILVVGAGGSGQEVLSVAPLQPGWRFVAVDPSQAMLDQAALAVQARGLATRIEWRCGQVEGLTATARFDAATLIGVLHHLPGDDAKQSILQTIAARLAPKAPLILACNRGRYADDPLFLDAWRARWRRSGASEAEIEARLGVILAGADPPSSDIAVDALLRQNGFVRPKLFFSSLFWGAWITYRHD